MKMKMNKILFLLVFLGMVMNASAQICDTTLFPGGRQYYDTYHDIVSVLPSWKHYNTHDPTVNKQGDWYYMYSTDASWANLHETGALKRRSKDLVNWEFLGNAFDGVPQSAVDFFKNNGNPAYTDQGIWAPFLLKYRDKYILYYSAPGGLSGVNFAFIGYATSDSAGGPWADQGMITTSYRDTINAIDPSVIYDSVEQRLWMAYGSWERGIHMLELDTATGGIKTPGDKGFKIARRTTFSAGLEGAEICYRNGWYYLFVSYDPLGDIYNVRVGRSRNAEGPYYDFNGRNMAAASDNTPMIQAPYKFNNHPGWQGTGHCGVFSDSGKYYMFNQGRPSIEPAMMVLHVREIFWLNDWPVLSPERYAGVPQCPVAADSLAGSWEHMPLLYHTAASAPHSTSEILELNADGTFNNKATNTWTFNDDTLTLNWYSGAMHKLIVFWGWDWENSCRTLLYTGMNKIGTCAWGKKIVQAEVDRYSKIVDGATYTIRNLHSNMLMHLPVSDAVFGAVIKQGYDNGSPSQLWKIKSAGNGYYYLFPQLYDLNLVMEVRNGATNNFAPMVVNPLDGSNKQKIKIIYNNNGYFHMMTKVTNDASCAEVVSFNITESGTINQNKYTGVLNQLFRFKKVDSIAIDTVSVDTFTVARSIEESSAVQVYPNPTADGKIFIDVSAWKDQDKISISVLDLKGAVVYHATAENSLIYELDLSLDKSVYILRLHAGDQLFLNKLVIQ